MRKNLINWEKKYCPHCGAMIVLPVEHAQVCTGWRRANIDDWIARFD